MAKNKVQFQKGYSLSEFLADYGTEAQCQQALSPSNLIGSVPDA